jgi:hypothetical protein
METLTINVNTIHGNFDFKITPIPFCNSVKIESECLFDVFRFEKYYDADNDCGGIDVYQNESGTFLFDTNCEIDFDSDTLSIQDLDKFAEIINIILMEYN